MVLFNIRSIITQKEMLPWGWKDFYGVCKGEYVTDNDQVKIYSELGSWQACTFLKNGLGEYLPYTSLRPPSTREKKELKIMDSDTLFSPCRILLYPAISTQNVPRLIQGIYDGIDYFSAYIYFLALPFSLTADCTSCHSPHPWEWLCELLTSGKRANMVWELG